MDKILVAYTTNSGSTQEVAEAVADELGKTGASVDIRRLEEVTDLSPYQLVVVGAPMILGWHRKARAFVKKHQAQLNTRKVAYFFTAMSLTATGETSVDGVPVSLDPGLAMPPADPGRLSFRENYSTPANYLRPVLKDAPQVKPVSVAFFGGKLEYFRLHILQLLFVVLVIRAQPGDRRDFDYIRSWTRKVISYQ